jgi:hypothetical protein
MKKRELVARSESKSSVLLLSDSFTGDLTTLNGMLSSELLLLS